MNVRPRGSGVAAGPGGAFGGSLGGTRAFRHRNYRLFFSGQLISVTGTWMQTVAQAWLVYRLTSSPLVLGVLTAVRFGPSLLGSPFAGVVADRFPRRSLVLLTQALSMLQAGALAALTLTGHVHVWHVLVLAAFQGSVDTLDMPARQTLQVDLVGVEEPRPAEPADVGHRSVEVVEGELAIDVDRAREVGQRHTVLVLGPEQRSLDLRLSPEA